jgi:hypothetical protein
MVHYHALFADLLGVPVHSEPADGEPAGQGSEQAVATGRMHWPALSRPAHAATPRAAGQHPSPATPAPLAGFTRGAGAGSPRWGCR